MLPTMPRSCFRSTKNSARRPSSSTATRISGPSAFTTSMFCMKALQFVAPAPDHHDIDVATLARGCLGRGGVGSTRIPSIQDIAPLTVRLAHGLLLPHGAGGVAAPSVLNRTIFLTT